MNVDKQKYIQTFTFLQIGVEDLKTTLSLFH